MRHLPTGLGTPYPLGELLPSVLQDDELAMRLTAGLDDVIAPAIAALDCLDAYLDPRLAPSDFLEWLGGWVGMALDENWSVERRRATVRQAVALYQTRGTVSGLRTQLELMTGGQVEVIDSGDVTWSAVPDAEFPIAEPSVTVTVRRTSSSEGINLAELDALVAAAKPASVPHRVELIESVEVSDGT